MLVEAAQNLNVSLAILDSPSNPASELSASAPHVHGSFKDRAKIHELAKKVDILTVEIEHVDTEALESAQNEYGVACHPSPATIRVIQDKYNQKVAMQAAGIPLPEFRELPAGSEAAALAVAATEGGFGFPVMLKSRTLAYDGRGNRVVRSADDIPAAIQELGGGPTRGGPGLYIEKWVPFTKEIAVMVAKSTTGEVKSYPVVETVQKDNICHIVLAPAQVDGGDVSVRARQIAEASVRGLDGAGIFGVEMFLLPNNDIILNEIAPRPHNSGHYTIEACHTSQFEQHLRCILGMPLGSCDLKVPAAAMVNILGVGDGEQGMADTLKPCKVAIGVPGATVHMYGKKECRKGRKMGHVTIVGNTMEEVLERVKQILGAEKKEEGSSSAEPSWTRLAPQVGIIMGSDSDLPKMSAAAAILEEFGVPYEISVVSAHRTPDLMFEYARAARERGIKVIIAGAGGAAHLPGMVAALTTLPVIGVPIALKHLEGQDSLLSIVQMPRGVPVATVAIDNSTNAALLAIRILGAHVPSYAVKLEEFGNRQKQPVLEKREKLKQVGWKAYLS
ncbi:phosphoribosylaminoimidazole carboxylase ade2 [Borealophlyctis nickersoniae]|nr:phosphoribosylaminoimidazole carboxylase ade2 [Borealophlyctis nickersoniae]